MGKEKGTKRGMIPLKISQHNFFILLFKREKYVNCLKYNSL